MSTTQEPIAVVGGGAAGIATALALAARGLPSRVFERAGSANEIDRGDIVHPGSVPLLHRWGAWDAVTAAGPLDFADFRVVDGDGSPLFTANTRSLLGRDCHLTALRHPDIVTALHAAAAGTGLVDFHGSEPVSELITERGRVTGVRTGGGAEYPAPVTVVATGTRSKLRAQHFGGHRSYDYGTSFFNARITALDAYRGCGYYVLDREGVLVMVALPGDEMRIGIQFDTAVRDDRPSAATFAAHARRILRPLRRYALDFIEGHTYRLEGVLADAWWRPGAVLAGDVAHTVHPTGGQGMNLAFGDAEALASRVAALDLAAGDAVDAACRDYAAHRRARVRAVFRRSHLGGRLATLRRPAAIAARRAVLRTADHLPPLKRAVIRRLVEVR
ncbi:NAD(P)/FAD-dependent oxidoreductase [Actinosynnema sp. NPDC050436]|uniref:FAD-dependent oxidoreductase n=1 Tax=Actinosynnema sp. NPDC050436 TaxID=3155659 RepID=UPI0033E4655D